MTGNLTQRIETSLSRQTSDFVRIDVWAGADHDGDDAIWVRYVLPDEDERLNTYEGASLLREQARSVAQREGFGGLVYVYLRGAEEEKQLLESE